MRRQNHPERDEEVIDQAAGVEDPGDDAHRLLRVVGAVIETEERRRHQLKAAEPAVHARGGVHRNSQKIAVIRSRPAANPISGERKMKMIVLVQPPDDRREARSGHGGSA
jgi:hypothetical protein